MRCHSENVTLLVLSRTSGREVRWAETHPESPYWISWPKTN
jgi:hypothetical protein